MGGTYVSAPLEQFLLIGWVVTILLVLVGNFLGMSFTSTIKYITKAIRRTIRHRKKTPKTIPTQEKLRIRFDTYGNIVEKPIELRSLNPRNTIYNFHLYQEWANAAESLDDPYIDKIRIRCGIHGVILYSPTMGTMSYRQYTEWRPIYNLWQYARSNRRLFR